MKKRKMQKMQKVLTLYLTAMLSLSMTACGQKENTGKNLLPSKEADGKVVILFSPMEKTEPDEIGRAHV